MTADAFGRSIDGVDRRIAVIGLGYVGLPLALAFQEAGLEVVAYEADHDRLRRVRSGQSPVDGVEDERLRAAIANGFNATDDYDRLSDANAIFVCVSTPLTADRQPDLEPVLIAARQIAARLRPGQLVILQSTTWPGTTAGPFRSELEGSGLVAGTDFGLAYAPERTNPGDTATAGSAIPRIVAGLTDADCGRCAALLGVLGSEVVKVSSLEAAELAKLHENVFRNVNIALANQLALLCEQMGLDAWEVIAAAATKPFGFMPFWPGPGVGGHCIPVDPFYLSWRARQFGQDAPFIDLAAEVNEHMSDHIVDLVVAALAERGIELPASRVGLVGVAFKPNVRDTRNAPSLAIAARLGARGANLAYHDPHVATLVDENGDTYPSCSLVDLVRGSDVLVALTGHDAIDWPLVYREGRVIVDAVNSSAGQAVGDRQVLRLGAGWR